MSTTMKTRATALVEWAHDGEQGILVHADRKGFWLLPGGQLKRYHDNTYEAPLAAVARELHEETGPETYGTLALFRHTGSHNEHHVFLIKVRGTLQVVDLKEAPAFGLCRHDMTITTILKAPGFTTDSLKLLNSAKAIITRYRALPEGATTAFRALAPADGAATTAPAITASASSRGDAPHHDPLKVVLGDAVLELIVGDIVVQDVDAIVNAANEGLANGSGVCGAIHERAGARQLEAACAALGGCEPGSAKITSGFNLTARHIIHAVGPRYRQHTKARSAELLASAYRSSLDVARAHGLKSIAFPSLSTGVFDYPIEDAAPVALKTVITYLERHQDIGLVRFVLRKDSFPVYAAALKKLDS